MNFLKNNNIIQAWLVLILALCFGAVLTGIQLYLSPVIEKNKAEEIIKRIPIVIFGEETAQSTHEQGKKLEVETQIVNVTQKNTVSHYPVYKAFEDGEFVGWAAKSSGQGYADKIELLIGFDPQLTAIRGIFILDQKETPGLGSKITETSWRNQFARKKTDRPFTIVKSKALDSNEISAVTGATISSKSVGQIVNKTVGDLKAPLAEKMPFTPSSDSDNKGEG